MKETLTAGMWRRTWYALASLPLGVVWFSVVTCGLAVGAALLITVLGVPVVLITLALARQGARAERRRARAVLTVGLPDRGAGSARGRIWSWPRLRQEAQDPPIWREIGYLLLALPAGSVAFSLVVTAWTVALSGTTAPLWYWAVPTWWDFLYSGNRLDSAPEWIGTVGVGIAFVFLTPLIVREVTAAQAWMARRLLG
jgi:Putative sensor